MIFDSKCLGKRLREIRNKRNLTQAEIAEGVGISKPVYSQYESGTKTPSLPQFILIAEYLNCSPNYLLQDYVSVKDDSQYLSSIIYSLTQMSNDDLEETAKMLENQRNKEK